MRLQRLTKQNYTRNDDHVSTIRNVQIFKDTVPLSP
jgi:hypothetical protein